MEPTAPVAAPPPPAASPAPTSMTAAEAAVAKSPRDYREARRAERAGKPLPSVDVTPDPAPAPAAAAPETTAPAPPPVEPKKYTLTQDELNERTRRAVEQALEADRRNRSTAAPAPPIEPTPAASAPPAETFPPLEQWAALPENEGKSFTDYLDARDDYRDRQRTESARVEQEFRTKAEALTKQTAAFANAMREAVTAEPDLVEKIPPAMRDPQASTPLSAMSPEQLKTAKFSNLVAEAAFRSAHPAALLKHLHAHQADTVRVAEIAQREGVAAALGALQWIDAQLSAAPASAPAAPTPKPKTLTDAPAPIENLGSRPAEVTDPMSAALKRGDTRSYRELRRQERAAQLSGRRL